VLTDGRIVYGNDGEELKAFNIKDGLGIKLLQRAGVAWPSSPAQLAIVERRARELASTRSCRAARTSSSPCANCARNAPWRSMSAPTWATTCRTSPPSAPPASA
jgi:hypothetical protein